MKCLFLGFAFLLLTNTDGAVLWRDPGPIESLDLIGGPGGNAKAPIGPFVFVEEASGGTAPKVIVKDARGIQWMVNYDYNQKQ